jgi:hypothetical protein
VDLDRLIERGLDDLVLVVQFFLDVRHVHRRAQR